MVRHDEEMFKVHPDDMCKWHIGDMPPARHPDTYPGIGTTIPQYHIPPGVAPMNAGLDAKLNIIIDLLRDIEKKLK